MLFGEMRERLARRQEEAMSGMPLVPSREFVEHRVKAVFASLRLDLRELEKEVIMTIATVAKEKPC